MRQISICYCCTDLCLIQKTNNWLINNRTNQLNEKLTSSLAVVIDALAVSPPLGLDEPLPVLIHPSKVWENLTRFIILINSLLSQIKQRSTWLYLQNYAQKCKSCAKSRELCANYAAPKRQIMHVLCGNFCQILIFFTWNFIVIELRKSINWNQKENCAVAVLLSADDVRGNES